MNLKYKLAKAQRSSYNKIVFGDDLRIQIINSEESEVCVMIEMKRTIVTEYRMAAPGSEFQFLL